MNDADDIDYAKMVAQLEPEAQFFWNADPPTAVAFQTHKFSILDVVAQASAALRTDPSEELERLTIGLHAARIIAILPHFTAKARLANGLLPKEGEYAVLGEITNRTVLLDKRPCMDYCIRLENNTRSALISIVNFQ